jgi:threonine dehydrogenase-like Zn-dependent dehydrogenase
MISRGTINVDALTGAVVTLSEAAEWFHRLREGEEGLMRVIVRP